MASSHSSGSGSVGCPMSHTHGGGATSSPTLYGAWDLNSLAVVLIATLFVLGLGVLTAFVAMERRVRRLKRHLQYGGEFAPDGRQVCQARLLDHDDSRCRRVCANCEGCVDASGECGCAPGHAAMDISMPPAPGGGAEGDAAYASQRGRMLQEQPTSERYVRLPTMTSFETLPSDREGRQWLGQSAARSRRRRGPFSQSTIASEARFSATHLSESAPGAGNTGSTPWTSPSPSTSGMRQHSAATLQPPHPAAASPPSVARSRGYPVASAAHPGGHFPAHPPVPAQQHQHQHQQHRTYAAAIAASKGSAAAAVIVGVSSSTAGDTPTDEAATGVITVDHEAIHASRSLPSGSDWDGDDDSGDYEDRSTLSGGSSAHGNDE